MIELEYEMTYAEQIDGPLGPTAGSPLGERLCWQVVSATLRGPRINASLAMPGMDWMRLGVDGVRRPDLRAQLTTDDGELILFRYEVAVIRSTGAFLAALASGVLRSRRRTLCLARREPVRWAGQAERSAGDRVRALPVALSDVTPRPRTASDFSTRLLS